MRLISIKNIALPLISLFTSFGTLICCALPALLVSIGAGAVLAGLVSNFPILLFLSKYKIYVFSSAGFLILISGYILWVTRNSPCPIDPIAAKMCSRLRVFSIYIYVLSVMIFLIGAIFAFVAPRLV
ncbi:MAG: hypothetical protein CMJ12_05310 [Pelagibacterales bacterium]|nr:hypothetical protein [Pelagibacterales bacterium]PPR16291.1 MAG: hypothetical protein CFH33_00851 [Alphaproteobacteria bacterium MarineAlpha9_Bin3]|tara:strand:+ start:28242 stop:28622 length:381 start_codon:yes stop_codon:yes gene_type:complete